MTSKSLDNIIDPFGTEEDKYRLVFNIAVSCEFPEFILGMNNLSHIWIELPSLLNLPNNFELLFKDKKKVILYYKRNIEETLDEYLARENVDYYIIRVHGSCKLPENINDMNIEIK